MCTWLTVTRSMRSSCECKVNSKDHFRDEQQHRWRGEGKRDPCVP